MKKGIWIALAMGSAAAVAAGALVDRGEGAAPSNPLANPSFESHPAFAGDRAGFTDIPGWQAQAGSLELMRTDAAGIKPADGGVMLHLDTAVNGVAVQDIPTIPGQRYGLGLMFSAREAIDPGASDIEVFWDDTFVGVLRGEHAGWQYRLFDVISADDLTHLSFKDASIPDGLGGMLDDVRLTALPYTSDNLVDNGSFEYSQISDDGDLALEGWLHKRGEFALPDFHALSIGAAEGAVALELDAGKNASVARDVSVPDRGIYELSFAYAKQPDAPTPRTARVRVKWNKKLLANLKTHHEGWQRHRFDVRAKDLSGNIFIRGKGPRDSIGGLVDDVRLYATCRSTFNLLENGSFEDSISVHGRDADDRRGHGHGGVRRGWRTDVGAPLRVAANNLGVPASEGEFMARMDGPSGNITLVQDFTTIPGRKYELLLNYRLDAPAFPGDGVRVWWGDELVAELTGSSKHWSPLFFYLEAAGRRTQLRLEGIGIPNNAGALVDDVAVYAVEHAFDFISEPPTESSTYAEYRYQPEMEASAGAVAAYELITSPEGMTIDPVTGEMLWTPEQAGSFEVTVKASASACGSIVEQSFNIDVAAGNRSPEITSVPPDETPVGEPFAYQVLAADPDGDNLEYRLESGPAGMEIDPVTGLIGWTPESEGKVTVLISVRDPVGAATEQLFSLNVVDGNAAPRISSFPITEVHFGEDYRYAVGATDADGDELTFSLEGAPDGMTINETTGVIEWSAPPVGGYAVTVRATDTGGRSGEQGFQLNVLTIAVPPDPSGLVPPGSSVEPGADFVTSIDFLYTGPNPVQQGLDPGVLVETRVAIVRGRVLDVAGEPLSGVAVSIAGHDEFGYGLTRDDGWFDMAVNGGGGLALNYHKQGYLPVLREIAVPREEFAVAVDVFLTRLDSSATVIRLGSSDTQAARGSVIDDGDGERQATVVFPPGTTAQMIAPDGSLQALDELTVRATEYTVGPNGPDAMPGELPPSTGYTYAVELSADEALIGGVKVAGKDVLFNQPVSVYVDNFIGFPVGGVVPVGYYDNDAARWVPSENGRVIEVLGVRDGFADLDLDGSGEPADTALMLAHGVTDAERAELAQLYRPGTSLWRFQTKHFSTWDCNWPYAPKFGLGPPDPPHCPGKAGPSASGSDISIAAGTMSERIGLPGVGQSLVFNSARNVAARLIQPLSGDANDSTFKRMEYRISIAGKVYSGNLSSGGGATINWDGKDAYGRMVRGPVTVYSDVANVFTPVRYAPAEFERVFASYMPMLDDPASRGANSIALTSDRANFEVKISANYSLPLGGERAVDTRSAIGKGQFSFSGLPVLNVKRGVLTSGSGDASRGGSVVRTLVGGSGLGLRAADENPTVSLAVDPSDSLVFATADTLSKMVDGSAVPAMAAEAFESVRRIRYARDGSLLILARQRGEDPALGPRLWSVSPSGAISLVAGSGQSGCGTRLTENGQTSFGLPLWNPSRYVYASSTALKLTDPSDVAVGRNGDIFLADRACHVVYWIRADDDSAYVIAGNGRNETSIESLPSSGSFRPGLAEPMSLALDDRGNLYIGTAKGIIRRWDSGNWIETLAGAPELGFAGDGGPALDARFGPISDIYVAADKVLYINDTLRNKRIRRIDSNGMIVTVAGNGEEGYSGDFTLAEGSTIGTAAGLAVDSDGWLYFGDAVNNGVRRVAPAYASFPWENEIRLLSGGGESISVYNRDGQLLRVLDAVTDAVRQQVSYDADRNLSGMVDKHGRETRIERDTDGLIDAIVSPEGQRTSIAYDEFDRPVSVTQPDGAVWQQTFDAGGFLRTFTDPNGHTTTFEYDGNGRLIKDSNPEGGGWVINHDVDGDAGRVRYISAEGRVNEYVSTIDRETGVRLSTITRPGGETTVTESDPLKRRSTTTSADGTVTISERFPTSAPAGGGSDNRTTVTLPSGLQMVTESRSTWSADPVDPESWALTRRVTVTNGDQAVTDYDPTANTEQTTSPEGRTSTRILDDLRRPVRTEAPGLAVTIYSYDDNGNIKRIVEGEGADQRETVYGYNALNHLQSVTDALDRTTTFNTDAGGRITQTTLPDGRIIDFDYDAKGNLEGVTPPGQPQHAMGYNKVDQETAYIPPVITEDTGDIATSYNLDKQLTRTAHDQGAIIGYEYNSAGRLANRTQPDGGLTYTYDLAGRTTGISTQSGEVLTYTYDGSLQASEFWSGSITGTVAAIYDNDFNLVRHTINGAHVIDYAYDRDDLLTRAGDLALTRDPRNGLLTATTLGSVTTGHQYNAFGELIRDTAKIGGNLVYDTTYARDKLGRITAKTEVVDGVAVNYGYGYDPGGRLIEMTRNGALIESWSYDANGNRTRTLGQDIATYDAQDRLLSYLESSRSLPGDVDLGYLVDGRDRRIGKTINGQLTQGFLFKDQLNPIAELDESGQVKSVFVYADKSHSPAYLTNSGNTYRIISDHLGSPRLVIDTDTGEIVQKLDYDVWGNVTENTDLTVQPFGFAGGVQDIDTGLVRFGARDYDPVTGRWLGKDPITTELMRRAYSYLKNYDLSDWRGTQPYSISTELESGRNSYAYVGGNPLSRIDPDGEYWRTPCYGIGCLPIDWPEWMKKPNEKKMFYL